MADQATVALNISNIANGEQKKKFQKAVDANTPVAPAGGGPAAPAGPETLALTDTVGKITAKEQEIADADTVLKSKYKEQADLYKLAAKQYGTLGGVVQTGSNGVASYIIGKGYDVVSPATHVTSLPQVTGLDAQDGDEEHSADLNCKSLRDHNVEYVFEGTQDPAGATGFHLIDVVKPSKCTAKNLAAGVWWFRVAARRNNVVGPWSQLSRYFAH